MTNRIYRYRNFLSWGQYLAPLLLNLMPLLVLAIHANRPSLPVSVPFLHLSLIMASTVILGIVFWSMFRRMANSAFSVQDDAIRYTRGSITSEFHLGDIRRIKFPSLQFCGGWMTIVTHKEVLRVTCALKNIDQFLLDLRSSLDARGLSDRYERGQFYKFLKSATYANQSCDRLEKHIRVLVLRIVLSIFVSALCLSITGINNLGSLAALVVLAGPVGIFFAAEYVLLQDFKSRCDENNFACPPPPIEFEHSVYRQAKWLCVALCLTCVVIALIVRFVIENILNLY